MGNILSASVRSLATLGDLACPLEQIIVVRTGEPVQLGEVWLEKVTVLGESGQLTYSEVRPVDL
jgi:hypothetical protein